MERFTITATLGEGSFGAVYKAQNRQTGEVMAVKHIKRRFSSWHEVTQLREVQSLQKLKHVNIISLCEVIQAKNDGSLYFIFEFADSDLYRLQKSLPPFSESQVVHVMRQLCAGLAHMHQRGYFHRDIKPENLLYMKTQERLLVADFGLARELRSRPPYTEYVSTRWYRAPEIALRDPAYTSPVDIWAAGCILGELLVQQPLFPGSSEVDQLHRIIGLLGTPTERGWPEGARLLTRIRARVAARSAQSFVVAFPSVSGAARDLLSVLLVLNPRQRASAAQALESTFLAALSASPLCPQISDDNSRAASVSTSASSSTTNRTTTPHAECEAKPRPAAFSRASSREYAVRPAVDMTQTQSRTRIGNAPTPYSEYDRVSSSKFATEDWDDDDDEIDAKATKKASSGGTAPTSTFLGTRNSLTHSETDRRDRALDDVSSAAAAAPLSSAPTLRTMPSYLLDQDWDESSGSEDEADSNNQRAGRRARGGSPSHSPTHARASSSFVDLADDAPFASEVATRSADSGAKVDVWDVSVPERLESISDTTEVQAGGGASRAPSPRRTSWSTKESLQLRAAVKQARREQEQEQEQARARAHESDGAAARAAGVLWRRVSVLMNSARDARECLEHYRSLRAAAVQPVAQLALWQPDELKRLKHEVTKAFARQRSVGGVTQPPLTPDQRSALWDQVADALGKSDVREVKQQYNQLIALKRTRQERRAKAVSSGTPATHEKHDEDEVSEVAVSALVIEDFSVESSFRDEPVDDAGSLVVEEFD